MSAKLEWVPVVYPPRSWGGPTWRLVDEEGTVVCALFAPDGEVGQWHGVFRRGEEQVTMTAGTSEAAAKTNLVKMLEMGMVFV
jgi:hypothetical protein